MSGFRLHRRFDRIGRLVGDKGMQYLSQTHVLVVGVGGVGSFAAESLVRSGVGKVTLVDFDLVCITNSNRQLQAIKGVVGKPKASVLAERLRLINPQAEIKSVPWAYDERTSSMLLEGRKRPDYVIDAIDNVSRSLAWIIYLNDVPEGEGETEFLYQGLRVTPKQGTLVMWPAQFTHTHRGNPVYNCTKYIATGWIEYADVHQGIGPWRIDDDTGNCYYVDNPPQDTCEDEDDDIICDKDRPKPYKKLSDLI